MSKNDDRIIALKKIVDEKKRELSGKSARFSPKTNCVLVLDGVTTNLNVCNENELQLLWIKLYAYVMAAEKIKLDVPKISGYDIQDWIDDIRNKLDVFAYRAESEELKKMENKLNKLLSDDKKTELELDDIEAMLK